MSYILWLIYLINQTVEQHIDSFYQCKSIARPITLTYKSFSLDHIYFYTTWTHTNNSSKWFDSWLHRFRSVELPFRFSINISLINKKWDFPRDKPYKFKTYSTAFDNKQFQYRIDSRERSQNDDVKQLEPVNYRVNWCTK